MKLSENLFLSRYATDRKAFLGAGGLVKEGAIDTATQRIIEVMDVRKSARDPEAAALSGGNLQKFIIGRELDRSPTVMVVNQPTWGVDAGAAAKIRQSLIELARSGSAVLVISQDLDELFEISDAIAVMHNGELSKPLPRAEATFEKIGLLMGGAEPGHADHVLEARLMRIELVRRPQHSALFSALSPFIALGLTLIAGAIMFSLLGKNPLEALYYYFIDPLTGIWDPDNRWQLHELAIKAAPLILIAVGLSVCYLSNNWNIGAEGQFIAGAIAGSFLPVVFPGFQSWIVLPLMLIMGMAGGAAYAAIPAFCKVKFNTNEILTSLMLVYVAQLFNDWLVRGIWRNPEGMSFPGHRPLPRIRDPAADLARRRPRALGLRLRAHRRGRRLVHAVEDAQGL